LTKDIFFALKHVLGCPKDASSALKTDLLWDTLMRLQEIEASSLRNLLSNLVGFVEVVHHEHYSADTMNRALKYLSSGMATQRFT
jgi:hypothetical protein